MAIGDLSFGEILRRERTRRGETQLQTAARFGVSQAGYSRWENGTAYPSDKHWKKMAGFLGMKIDELYAMFNEQEGIDAKDPMTLHKLAEDVAALERVIEGLTERLAAVEGARR